MSYWFRTRLLCTLFGVVLLASVMAAATQQHKEQSAKTAAPKASKPSLFERAETARQTGDLATAIRLYQEAIVATPDDMMAHKGLEAAIYSEERNRAIAAGGLPNSAETSNKAHSATFARLKDIYQRLLTAHPQVVVYQYQLALAEHADDGKLGTALEELVAAHPTFTPALEHLADHAELLGNVDKEREYLRRACLAQAQEAKYAYAYLSTYKLRDRKEHRRLVEDFVARYPKSDLIPDALKAAAADADTQADRIALLERAASLSGNYYVPEILILYARTDVSKAADLAEKKLNEARNDPKATWEVRYLTRTAEYYRNIAGAEELLKAGKFAEAQSALDKAKPEASSVRPVTFPLTKVKVDLLVAQGKNQDAYNLLLDDKETLADPLQSAMTIKIGAQLGKTEAKVLDDVMSAITARAKQPDFKLANLKGDGQATLSDYRGKFVLVNFWHPT